MAIPSLKRLTSAENGQSADYNPAGLANRRLELPVEGFVAFLGVVPNDLVQIPLAPSALALFIARRIEAGARQATLHAELAHVLSFRGWPERARAYLDRQARPTFAQRADLWLRAVTARLRQLVADARQRRLRGRVRSGLGHLKALALRLANGPHKSAAQGPASERAPADEGKAVSVSAAALFQFLEIPVANLEAVMYSIDLVVFNLVPLAVAAGHRLEQVYAELGHVMSYRAQPNLAVDYFRRSIATAPDRQRHERLFHMLMVAPDTTNETMLAEARRWAVLYAPSRVTSRRFALDRDPDRRLRIGYVCHFFHASTTRNGLHPTMRRHDRKHFEIIAYSDIDAPVEDSKTADLWRSTAGMDDDAFEKLILDDRIDILVELNGRGGPSRLEALGRRLAPIQINFGNFPTTTGMPEIDYTIAHTVCVPPEEDRFYTEKVCRLNLAVDYTECWPEGYFPPVAPPPYRKAGRITFGCFGSSVKVNEETIRIWCEIVNRIESARFFFKSVPLSDAGTMRLFERLFARYGLGGDRLILEGFSEHRTMLERYGAVDIALDTFPYNGGSTTLEALWQGIPVVTLMGNRWPGRTGASFLIPGGFEELIARSPEEFIDKAVRLAADHAYRERFRVTARDRLRGSPLMDMERFAREIEDAFRSMWVEWLNHGESIG